jgi:hypothetical protein
MAKFTPLASSVDATSTVRQTHKASSRLQSIGPPRCGLPRQVAQVRSRNGAAITERQRVRVSCRVLQRDDLPTPGGAQQLLVADYPHSSEEGNQQPVGLGSGPACARHKRIVLLCTTHIQTHTHTHTHTHTQRGGAVYLGRTWREKEARRARGGRDRDDATGSASTTKRRTSRGVPIGHGGPRSGIVDRVKHALLAVQVARDSDRLLSQGWVMSRVGDHCGVPPPDQRSGRRTQLGQLGAHRHCHRDPLARNLGSTVTVGPPPGLHNWNTTKHWYTRSTPTHQNGPS